MFSIIKPRGDIKSNWESANPILRLREWGIEWEETVGSGEVKVKIGDGVKHWNELDYAIVNDVTKKIVKTFAEINADDNPNPILNPGESIELLFGKIKQKFEYTTNFMTTLKNMVGDYQSRTFNTGSGTVTAADLKNAIDILEQYKLTTANILDVNDSTNTLAALSANQGRLINEKAVANANAINTLNSNLASAHTNPILIFNLNSSGSKFVEFRRSQSGGAYTVEAVYTPSASGTKKYYMIIDGNGNFAPGKVDVAAFENLSNSVNQIYNLSSVGFVQNFNGGENSMTPGRWRVYNSSGTEANAPYSGAVSGYVDIVVNGNTQTAGTLIFQTLHDYNGDVYTKVVNSGNNYGTWKKLT